MYGEVTILVRDKDTEEIISEIKKKNIITENLYHSLRSSDNVASGLRFQLAVTSAVMGHAKESYVLPLNGNSGIVTSIRSSDIVGVTTPQFIPKSGELDAFIQYSGRWSAPNTGTTRLINAIALIANSTTTTMLGSINSFDIEDRLPYAYTQLDIPCTQLDNQVLDIYYRLYLPYNETEFNIPSFSVNERVKHLLNADSYTNYHFYSYHKTGPFPPLRVRTEDLETTFIGSWPMWISRFRLDTTATTSNFGTRVFSNDMSFTYKAGNIISHIYNGSILNAYGQPIVHYSDFSKKFSKIQNCIGHGPESTNTLSTPWQDVDNLVSGTGQVHIEGDWQNRYTIDNPPLYSKVKLPEWNHITITSTGNIGVSTYKYTSQKFFGNLSYNVSDSPNGYCVHWLMPLCATTNYSDATRTLLGNTNEITVKQLSTACKYDETSIIIARPESLILYSVAGSEYWKITGSYTNIHQLAVLGDVIWIACRNTGLWAVNPKVSLTPTKIDATSAGINFNKCHGVAVGYSNTIWAVASNSLAKWDGSSWTKYDENTSPAFKFDSITGGSGTESWENIEYIKVDNESPDNQMMAIRKVGASVFSTKLGVWWSTATSSVNTGDEPTGSSSGRPRVHRNHVNVLSGFWCIQRNNSFYRSAFGGTSWTSIYTMSSFSYGQKFYCSSVNLIKDATGTPLLITTKNSGSITSTFNEFDVASTGPNVVNTSDLTLINSSGSIVYNSTTSQNGLMLGYAESNSSYMFSVNTESVPGYGGDKDLSHNILLDKGVLVILCKASNNIGVGVYNYGLDRTPHGGALRWLARTEYGWNGSAWVEGNNNSKPTHLTADPIMDGVTVRFTEGATGTSFVANDYYKYGLCEGLMKDNATRANITVPFHFRKTFVDNTEISTNTIPAITALPTGIIGAHSSFNSSGTYLNANNEPVFPGQNSRQYMTGDKMLTGNFEISYEVTNLNDASMRDTAVFGVSTYNGYWPDYGIVLVGGTIYYCQGSATGQIRSNLNSLTSLTLKRTGNTLTISANGSVIHTYTGTALIKNNQRLFHTWMVRDIYTYNFSPNTRAPKATIVSNGSDNAVFVGSSANGTGWFNPRFYGIDTYSPISVTIDGVAAPVLLDGTDPVPGSVSVSPWMGAFYFNSADQGKPITASFTYQVSGA